MTNTIAIIRSLSAPTSRERNQPLKSRRLRRQEQRQSAALLRSNAKK